MTMAMCIKWLKWIKNMLIVGSDPYIAIEMAISKLEEEEPKG